MFCHLDYLAIKLIKLGLRHELGVVVDLLDFEKAADLSHYVCPVDDLDGLDIQFDIQIRQVLLFKVAFVVFLVSDSKENACLRLNYFLG